MQAGPPVIPAFRGPVIIHLRTTTTHGRILGAKEARSCEIRSKRANPLISSPSPHAIWSSGVRPTQLHERAVCACVAARRQNASSRSEAEMLISACVISGAQGPMRAHSDITPPRLPVRPELTPVNVSLCSATNHRTNRHQSYMQDWISFNSESKHWN